MSRSLQRWVVNESMRGEDAGWRMRCKIIRNLARGESPTQIHRILCCARSQVYEVAAKFLEHGVEGLEDGRESNGSPKVTTEYSIIVLAAVSGSPKRTKARVCPELPCTVAGISCKRRQRSLVVPRA